MRDRGPREMTDQPARLELEGRSDDPEPERRASLPAVWDIDVLLGLHLGLFVGVVAWALSAVASGLSLIPSAFPDFLLVQVALCVPLVRVLWRRGQRGVALGIALVVPLVVSVLMTWTTLFGW